MAVCSAVPRELVAATPLAPTCLKGTDTDLDNDGDVDLDDFSTFTANYTGTQ